AAREPSSRSRVLTTMRTLFIVSVCLGGIILVPSGAHLLEMPRKLLMSREAFFSAQQMYLGWALFGIPITLKVVIDAVLGVSLWRISPASARAALVSAILIAAGLAVFFVWVQPANTATANWSMQPSDWTALRTKWEWG